MDKCFETQVESLQVFWCFCRAIDIIQFPGWQSDRMEATADVFFFVYACLPSSLPFHRKTFLSIRLLSLSTRNFRLLLLHDIWLRYYCFQSLYFRFCCYLHCFVLMSIYFLYWIWFEYIIFVRKRLLGKWSILKVKTNEKFKLKSSCNILRGPVAMLVKF